MTEEKKIRPNVRVRTNKYTWKYSEEEREIAKSIVDIGQEIWKYKRRINTLHEMRDDLKKKLKGKYREKDDIPFKYRELLDESDENVEVINYGEKTTEKRKEETQE